MHLTQPCLYFFVIIIIFLLLSYRVKIAPFIEMRKILALLALCFAQYVGGIREGNFRSNFFKTLPKHRMTGHVIKTVTASSQLLCAQKCLAHDACKSCNFRTSGDHYKICELNSRGLLSQAHDPDLAHDEVFLFIYVENVSINVFVSVFFL